jgi:aerobic carbon-monoxide dehydrogenase large subunit
MRDTKRLTGQKVRRLEDQRLLSGSGNYIDDVVVPDMAHATFVRSTVPHAEIRSISTTAAAALPGVHAVLTGDDITEITRPMFGFLSFPGLFDPMYHSLAVGRVRHVGDPVAIVVAESRRVAEDAAEMVEIDYEPLDPIADPAHAFDPDRPAIWPDAAGNVLRRTSRVHGDVDAAFSTADRVVSARLAQTRHANQPMETRGSVAEWVPSEGRVRFHAAHQSAHMLKWGLGLFATPVSFSTGVRQLVGDRARLGRFFAGLKQMGMAMRAGGEGPAPVAGYVPPDKPDLKPMVQQLRAQKGRFSALTKAMMGLLANGHDRVPEVVVDDVGGAFGCKTGVVREDVTLCAVARHLQRSIKWIEDRNEHLMVGGHGRDEAGVVDVAVRDDGTILGMRVHLTHDQGAYPNIPYTCALFGEMARVFFPGPYRLPALQFDQVIVSTNKASIVPYRGPWAVETWLRERMMDITARELGMSPTEIRRRNVIGSDELPRQMLTGPVLDVRMSAKATLEKALEVCDAESWPAVRDAARTDGRVVGMGIATFIEAAPGSPGHFEYIAPGGVSAVQTEPIRAVLRPDGHVDLHTQQVPHGQGIETTLAQLASDQLGVPYETIHLVYGDTANTPFGIAGTGGSRSAANAGGATELASQELRAKIIDIAADLLEASVDDLAIVDGNIHVAGVPARGITMADVAREAATRHDGEQLETIGEWSGGEGGWTQATHVCFVEIDLETGFVAIPRYIVVEDCGEIINPAIVDGQIRGGIAQGIGSVLYERITYDEDANFKSGTFMDYLIPTAMEIPDIEIHHLETPSDIQANYRGVGEGGMILAPAAITNAIEDALSHLGVRITEQHLPPHRILELAGIVPTGV